MTISYKNLFFKLLRLISVFLCSTVIFISLYFLFQKTGWLGKFQNIQELKKIILSAGFLSYFVFALLQFLQVVILPLPSIVTTIVGVIIFGPFATFLISLLSILIGSITAFLIGKIIGIKVLIWSIGEKQTKQFQKLIAKGKIPFFLMMLFPFFPDDILCLLAGVSNMNFKFFLITNIISRSIGIFCTCFLGGGLSKFI